MRTARSSSWVGVYLSAWWDPPWVWAWRPPWVWAWRPPGQTPHLCPWVCSWRPPSCGPGDHQVWAWRHLQIPDTSTSPTGCRPGDPPGQTSQLRPLWCGPADLQGMLGYHPPGDLQGMLGYQLQCMLGYHPGCEQNDRDVQKY